MNIFREAKVADEAYYQILISQELSEEFRDIFTRRLAKVGFNENYDLTTEGQILENLIDHFFIRDEIKK